MPRGTEVPAELPTGGGKALRCWYNVTLSCPVLQPTSAWDRQTSASSLVWPTPSLLLFFKAAVLWVLLYIAFLYYFFFLHAHYSTREFDHFCRNHFGLPCRHLCRSRSTQWVWGAWGSIAYFWISEEGEHLLQRCPSSVKTPKSWPAPCAAIPVLSILLEMPVQFSVNLQYWLQRNHESK